MQVAIIDKDGKFTEPEFLKGSELIDVKEFFTVAIFGAQSSGKSTLLNLLFETHFSTMNASLGPSQTTQGVWVAQAANARNLLVMDVEGVDGIERGPESNFEKKTGLFALAISQVLIINMWARDVGRSQAANLPLLQSIFDIHLQMHAGLDKSKIPRSLLLFVLRDHDEIELEMLRSKIMANLNAIWDRVEKPATMAQMSLHDFYDFDFVSLPHKIHKNAEFLHAVKVLQSRFIDASMGNDYIFANPAYHSSVPASDFSHFASSIWTEIINQRDLDIPSQKELLSLHRCEEIASQVRAEFTDFLRKHQQEDLPEPSSKITLIANMKGFGQAANDVFQAVLEEYAADVQRYLPKIVAAKKKELENNMIADALPLLKLYANAVKDNIFETFEATLSRKVEDEAVSVSSFTAESAAAQSTPVSYGKFSKNMCEWGVEEYSKRSEPVSTLGGIRVEEIAENIKKQLIDQMSAKIDLLRQSLLRRFEENLIKFSQSYFDGIETVLLSGKDDVWEEVSRQYSELSDQVEQIIRSKAVTLDLKGDALPKFIKKILDKSLRSQLETTIQDSLREKSLKVILKQVFETAFKRDENGLPRRWVVGMDVSDYYQKALKRTEAILKVYQIPALTFLPTGASNDGAEEDDSENSSFKKPLFDRSVYSDVLESVKREAEVAYVDVADRLDSKSVNFKIPQIFWVILFLLGMNEIWYIVTSPLLFFFSLFAVGIIFIGFQMLSQTQRDFVIDHGISYLADLLAQYIHIAQAKIIEMQGGAAAGGSGGGDSSQSTQNSRLKRE